MKIKIGFLHRKEKVTVMFNGSFEIMDRDGKASGSVSRGQIIDFTASDTVPAEYEWYEKVDTVFDINKLEQKRDKYYLDGGSTRVIKVGREAGGFDNSEYWLLKKTADMEGKIYPSGDYRYKKIIKKESEGSVVFSGGRFEGKVVFVPENDKCSFIVKNVSVGIDFHWDHKEDLEYRGSLEIIVDTYGSLTTVNELDAEDYLASVNSSEMRNDNNIEMLKAQTVAARSTVMATMGKHHFGEGFDLCADDHCQCYQGIGKMSDLSVAVAKSTESEVLVFDSRIVDARYSKICGGITEKYSSCWEDMDFPYLAVFYDNPDGSELRTTVEAPDHAKLIEDEDFDCFCNTKHNALPASLQFCKDLFRWKEQISFEKIGMNLKAKFGREIGIIIEIKALERGLSGRIIRLEVTGTEGKCEISKELNIRRLLSETHLPSSAFIYSRTDSGYDLKGAGWGHGVGLCQIGAQIMGDSGYGYREILKHYYRGAALKKIK
jgi:stage II sporulation protein D